MLQNTTEYEEKMTKVSSNNNKHTQVMRLPYVKSQHQFLRGAVVINILSSTLL